MVDGMLRQLELQSKSAGSAYLMNILLYPPEMVLFPAISLQVPLA